MPSGAGLPVGATGAGSGYGTASRSDGADSSFGASWQSALSSAGLRGSNGSATPVSGATGLANQNANLNTVQSARSVTTGDQSPSAPATIASDLPANTKTVQTVSDSKNQFAAGVKQQAPLPLAVAAGANQQAETLAELAKAHSAKAGSQKTTGSGQKISEKDSSTSKTGSGSSALTSAATGTDVTTQPTVDASTPLYMTSPIHAPVHIPVVEQSSPSETDKSSATTAELLSSDTTATGSTFGTTLSGSWSASGVTPQSSPGLRSTASPRIGTFDPTGSDGDTVNSAGIGQGTLHGSPIASTPEFLPTDGTSSGSAQLGTSTKGETAGETAVANAVQPTVPVSQTTFKSVADNLDGAALVSGVSAASSTSAAKNADLAGAASTQHTAGVTATGKTRTAQPASVQPASIQPASVASASASRTSIAAESAFEPTGENTVKVSTATTSLKPVDDVASKQSVQSVAGQQQASSADEALGGTAGATTAQVAAHSVAQAADTNATSSSSKSDSNRKSTSSSTTSVSGVGTGPASAAATEDVHHLSSVNLQNAGTDSTGVARDMAGMRSEQLVSHGASADGSARSGNSTAQETFAALDSSGSQVPTQWVQTGTRHAEAGYQDPNLGWVGVRAEVSGGSVHASIVPSSAGAAEALSQHMSGLNNYLSENHSSVSSLTMTSPDGQGSLGAGTQSFNQGNSPADSSSQRETASADSARIADAGNESASQENYAYSSANAEGRLVSLVA
jgi:hypothetical protein